jgi:hypothetical protein
MMNRSVSYVTCKVNMMTRFYMHVVMNKFTHSQILPLVGGLVLVKAI